jgi:hypothetical protein
MNFFRQGFFEWKSSPAENASNQPVKALIQPLHPPADMTAGIPGECVVSGARE